MSAWLESILVKGYEQTVTCEILDFVWEQFYEDSDGSILSHRFFYFPGTHKNMYACVHKDNELRVLHIDFHFFYNRPRVGVYNVLITSHILERGVGYERTYPLEMREHYLLYEKNREDNFYFKVPRPLYYSATADESFWTKEREPSLADLLIDMV